MAALHSLKFTFIQTSVTFVFFIRFDGVCEWNRGDIKRFALQIHYPLKRYAPQSQMHMGIKYQVGKQILMIKLRNKLVYWSKNPV